MVVVWCHWIIQIMRISTIKSLKKLIKNLTLKIIQDKISDKNKILPDIPYNEKDPVIIQSYRVYKIEKSDIVEPEPLP